MALLNDVKPRLGVFYSDANKDAEIQKMIDAAQAYFKGAGWNFSTLLSSKKEYETIIEGLEADKAAALAELEEEGLTEEEIAAINENIATIESALLAAQGELEGIDVALATDAIILYCKMAQSTDASQLTNHPVLISFIAQNRTVVADVTV